MADRYIREKSLIDEIVKIKDLRTLSTKTIGKAISNVPTADVVEVVRCKDCKYWQGTSFDAITGTLLGECRKPLGDYRYCETEEYDFCSYGEWKEEE